MNTKTLSDTDINRAIDRWLGICMAKGECDCTPRPYSSDHNAAHTAMLAAKEKFGREAFGEKIGFYLDSLNSGVGNDFITAAATLSARDMSAIVYSMILEGKNND